MRDLILAILILFGAAVILVLIFALIAAVTGAGSDQHDEDVAQQNFLRGYFNRKDDNND